MVTYAAWLEVTERYLRNPDDDDVYRRPLFSILDDDPWEESDPEHEECSICQGNRTGYRWVPDNGGAWVDSHMWEVCKKDFAEYMKKTKHWGELPC